MNKRHFLRGKARGVTPVIATILLIGLVVVAGIAVAIVMFSTINTPTPMDVEIVGISDFETTDADVLIDQFSVTIHNEERSTIRIEYDAFTLEHFNGTSIVGWRMDPDQAIYLSPEEIMEIDLVCDPITGDQLRPDQDKIIIQVKVFPSDSTNERLAQTFSSDLLSVGNTHGPIFLEKSPQGSILDLNTSGLEINFTITNNGSADQDLILELYADDFPQNITFSIEGVNRTTFSFTTAGFSNTLINSIIFPTLITKVDEIYLVRATLRHQEGAVYSFFTLVYKG